MLFKHALSYILVALVLLFILPVTGYLLAFQESRSGLIMSHKYKIETIGMPCTLCHTISDKDTRFVTFPGHETCSLCHKEAVDEASEKKNCELCHNLPNYDTHVRKNIVLAPHVRFDHKKHEQKGIGCVKCHPITDSPIVIANEMLPVMETCTACHAERAVMDVKDCSGCHIKGFEKIPSLDHTGTWLTAHGKRLSREKIDTDCRICHTVELKNSCTRCHHREEYRVGKMDYCVVCHGKKYEKTRPADHTPFWLSKHGKGLLQVRIDSNCSLCHTPQYNNDCQSCHRRENPVNHTTAWRIRSHGNRAQINRQNCSTCHDQSECIVCHTTNEPFSHTGLWSSPYNRHCINCHMEGGNYASGAVGSNCTFCHQSSAVYAKHVSLQKPGHYTTSDCTNCHRTSGGFGTDILHPYPPDALKCISCHQ